MKSTQDSSDQNQKSGAARKNSTSGILPGLLLTGSIAATGFALHSIPNISFLSPMILSILIGVAFNNIVGTPAFARNGVRFALRRILRCAIILLGLQLTVTQMVGIGGRGIAVILLSLIATFFFTRWIGHVLGVDRGLSQLIAVGTSICGASAVIAANTVTGAKEEDVVYSVACVTVFGSLSMFIYPLLPSVLDLSPQAYGLWAGSSIHEIAQVVAAAFQHGQTSGEFGTVAKLSRVMLLAPLVMMLGFIASRARTDKSKPQTPTPWFILGFIAMIALNSIISIPTDIKKSLVTLTAILLSVALAAMGLETDLRNLKEKGARPLLVGGASWLFISCLSLLLIKLIV